MAKKKIPIASVRKALLKNPPSNVTIIDPETDEVTTTSDTTTKSMSFIPLNKKGEPIPQSKGTGRKECPSCHFFIAPVAAVCPNPSCRHEFVKGEKAPKGTRAAKATEQSKSPIDEKAFIRVLANKGFKFVRLVNELNGEVVKDERDPKIDKLNLIFAPIPANGDGVYITQTNPQIQVAMPLEKFLELAGIKP